MWLLTSQSTVSVCFLFSFSFSHWTVSLMYFQIIYSEELNAWEFQNPRARFYRRCWPFQWKRWMQIIFAIILFRSQVSIKEHEYSPYMYCIVLASFVSFICWLVNEASKLYISSYTFKSPVQLRYCIFFKLTLLLLWQSIKHNVFMLVYAKK